ncbi:ABC transporter substrate-binding protein [Nonomuraea sp. 3-1Str]|uniref:ABC transporter substrate-binding protein n=1 Tax=Nonomuraea sp. 3-1Str TaxID=2929801 RepID=UPI00285F598D|nr:ABC transporter substrate-binding protein [Nonomuraea sp. 3-1Str]MDR8407283.1 ABC transporter substrate-binding protein [Nonomuraea sp. 3-1Str]
MKHLRRTLPLLVAASLTVTACGGAPRETAAAADGGSLTWAVETQPVTFNPHLWAQNKARLLVWNQFDALLSRGEDGSFAPWLARSWEVSADGRTYTFHLREGVTFHDGEKFDAAAVKANLDRFRVPGYNPTVASIQLSALERVEVVSPAELKVHLKRPDALFLDFLASPYGGQVSPKSLRTAKNLKAGGPDLVGTGPFILDRYVQGQEVHYRRNPAYAWAPPTAAHQGPAHLAEVTYRFLPESAVRVGALTSGQAEVIEGVPATEVDLVKKDPDLAFQTALNSGSAYTYYFNTGHAPFDDKRVREAFREAVDLDAVLASVYRGQATRAWSVVGKAGPFYDASLERTYGGDTAKANALLDQAGWTTRDAQGFRTRDGKRLTVRTVSAAPFVRDRREILAQAIQAQVKQNAGIDFQIRIVDQGSAQQALDRDEYEVFENSRGDTDAGAALNLILARQAPINRTHFSDASIDTWLTRASRVSDVKTRTALYAKVQRAVVAENAIAFPIYVPSDQLAARRSVSGLGFDPVSGTPKSAYDVRIAP